MLRNKDQEHNNPLASFAQPASAGKGANCAIALSVLGPRGHYLCLMGLLFSYLGLPTCLVEFVLKSDFHLNNVLCSVVVLKKRKLLCLAQVVFSYFVLHSNKIPLVLTTKITHLSSLLFRQPDGVNCVVRSYFGGCPKTE